MNKDSRFIVNSFQVPNAFVDEALEMMSGNACKLYLIVARKTRGWQKESDAISLSQFEKYGMARKTVLAAIDELTKLGLVVKTSGQKGINVYALNDCGWCKNYTSGEITLVEKLHQTGVKTTPVTGVKSTHTIITIKYTPKKTPDRAKAPWLVSFTPPVLTKPKAKAPKKAKADQSELEARFERFWSAYPRKVAKPKARDAFFKHQPDDVMLAAMLKAITDASARDDWPRDNYRYCPHPTTWLNQQRWADEGNQPSTTAVDPAKTQGSAAANTGTFAVGTPLPVEVARAHLERIRRHHGLPPAGVVH